MNPLPPLRPLSEPVSTYSTSAPWDWSTCLPLLVFLAVAALGLYYAVQED